MSTACQYDQSTSFMYFSFTTISFAGFCFSWWPGLPRPSLLPGGCWHHRDWISHRGNICVGDAVFGQVLLLTVCLHLLRQKFVLLSSFLSSWQCLCLHALGPWLCLSVKASILLTEVALSSVHSRLYRLICCCSSIHGSHFCPAGVLLTFENLHVCCCWILETWCVEIVLFNTNWMLSLCLWIQSFHCKSPRKLPLSRMDPSCTIGFFVRDRRDFELCCSAVEEVSFFFTHVSSSLLWWHDYWSFVVRHRQLKVCKRMDVSM